MTNILSERLIRIVAAICLFCSVTANATILVSDQHYTTNGIGYSGYSRTTELLNAASGGNYTTGDLSNAALVASADALWIDLRNKDLSLSAIEQSNIQAFAGTGKRIVFIGEAYEFNLWNNSFLSLFGGVAGDDGWVQSGNASLLGHELLNGVDRVNFGTGNSVTGGTSLFNTNGAALFGSSSNVLAVMDMNIFSNSFIDDNNNLAFVSNVTTWVGTSAVPEPATLALMAIGLFGVGVRRRIN